MNKILYFFLALSFISCQDSSKYIISGTVDKGELNGKYVYLYEYGLDVIHPIDSALVTDGKFKFEGSQDSAILCILEFDITDVPLQREVAGQNNPYRPVFILENGNLHANLTETPFVTGTFENDNWTALQKEIKTFRNDRIQLMEEMYSSNPDIANIALNKHRESEALVVGSVEKYIQTYPDKLSAGKLFVNFYNSLDEEFRHNIVAVSGHSFRSVYGMERLIKDLQKLHKFRIGKLFTDFEMVAPDGKVHKLSEYAGKGEYILLDFWASWCGPCLDEIPNLKRTYTKFHPKGFEIIGISLDSRKSDWLDAIQKHELKWLHLSDLKKWDSEAVTLYNVNYIPYTILLDKEGIIIGKNLRGSILDSKLEELLK